MKHKTKLNLSVLLTTLLSAFMFSSVVADEDKSGLELVGGIGKYYYDASNLDDGDMVVLGIGYRFDSNWQIELIRGNPDTTTSPGNASIDVDWTALRGLYLFDNGNSFTPYISAGIDSMDVYSGETQGVLGLGLKVNVTDNFFWRLEGNYHTEEGENSILALLGYHFGGSTPAPAKPKDSDGDGVMDNTDACPRTPAGDKVDHTGCTVVAIPDKDSDNDGVIDKMDKCPNTPANALVNADGCQKELTKTVSVDLKINFDTNKDVVKAEDFSEVERVAKFMMQYAGTAVVIGGHTDSVGKASYNEDLSSRRAKSVANLLIEKYGIAANRVESNGFGETQPIADNNTAEGRSENRRVVAIIKQQVKEKQWIEK